MWLGAFVEEQTGKKMRVWTGECHVHAALRPDDVQRMRDEHPDADMLIHPECGCTTAVMEYLSHGDIDAENTHMLSTGGMLTHAASSDAKEFIVATETGMIHPLEEANPDKEFIPLDRKAVCQYMKMITLPKVRDALLDETGAYEVKVPEAIAEKARVPIERMISITP
jgi:quinolinate synthase